MFAAQSHPAPRLWSSPYLPGLSLAVVIALGAVMFRQVSGLAALSPMLVAILVGIGIRVALPRMEIPSAGLNFAVRPVLRAGIVLLGLQVTMAEIGSLGIGVALVAALTLAATYGAVRVAARVMNIPKPLAQLIAAGTAVCGASAVVAANSVARGSQEDVGYAVASVTLFGTLAMLVLPLLFGPLGLSQSEFGVWVGASVHEVAQVTAAAFQVGEDAGQVGTITKLLRVMMLAPLVLAMAMAARRPGQDSGGGKVAFPWFVIGFLALVVLNSVVELPDWLRDGGSLGATICMSTGLAAMGLGINLKQLRKRGLKPLALGAFGFVFVLGFSYGAVTVLL